MIKITSGKHLFIPTPPILYGGSELEAALTANSLIESGFDVCLDANPRSTKVWDYYFTTNPPSLKCQNVELEITYLVPPPNSNVIHVFQGRPFQTSAFKIFASEPQYNYYKNFIADIDDFEIIPNTIPEWLYTPREKWDDGDYYLFLNRCDRNKGCAEFVDWCIKNNYKCKMITQFWFVEDLQYAQAVVQKAQNHGIDVLVNVDPLTKIEIIKGAKAIVAFLSKSYFEGYGIWVHEANYLRVPVISTNVQAVPWTMMKGELIMSDGSTIKFEKDEAKWREERSYKNYKEKWVKLAERFLSGKNKK